LLHLISNGHVYAPEDLGLQHLLVAAGRIVWMGPVVPELTGVELQTIDLQGMRVLPGFVDCHAHLTGGGGESGFSSRVPAVPLSHFTSAGVTSVIGVLGTDDTTRDTRSLVAQTNALREEGLGAWCHTGGYHVPPTTFTGSVRDDIVYLDPVIGVGEIAISDHRSSQPTLSELLRLASDAHVAGLITGKAGLLHLHLGDGDRGLDLVRQALDTTELPPRVFNPTHINRRKALFEEALEVAKRGCTVDITAFPLDDEDVYLSAPDALLRYLDSGAPPENVTISSDGGGCLPKFNDQREVIHMDVGKPSSLIEMLQELLRLGGTLESALPAFTSNVAKIMRLHDRGRIGTGLAADLVVLDSEQQIQHVMVGGTWHVLDGEQQVRGYFENTNRQ
jgi:beta-aspartyl-dipeptidase (metallo-type)